MAHEILAVKLCELDERLARLHGRIHMTESAGRERLRGEISALSDECDAGELALGERLRNSKAGCLAPLAEVYGRIEADIRAERERRGGSGAEERLLLAEYALDFAMQAADRALLAAMRAIDAERENEERNR